MINYHIFIRLLITSLSVTLIITLKTVCLLVRYGTNSRVRLLVYRPGYFTVHPPPPAPSGPKFSNSENCCGSENAMPPKIFWDMEGHRGHFRSKNVFFSKNIFWKKFIINLTIFLIFRYAFYRY